MEKKPRAARAKRKSAKSEEEDLDDFIGSPLGAISMLIMTPGPAADDEEDDGIGSSPVADNLEYYKYLGVPKTATADEIKKAYQVRFAP